MANKIRVLVCCATSIATATVAAVKMKEIAQEAGVDVDVAQCKVAEVRGKIQTYAPHMIIGMTPPPPGLGIPVFNGVPFLSGLGMDKLKADIIATIKSLK
jgi:PTS system galactitol-specific IIB component